MSGYARIHRSLIGHPAFRNDAEGMAFAWMVLRASWKPQRVRYKGRAFALNRGQLAVSQRDMAVALDRDKAWIERLWKRLRAEAMIEVAYEAGSALITICNYAEYQADCEGREAPSEAPAKAAARQAQGTEQGTEKGKEERKPAPKRVPRPTFEIPDWVPAEAWAAFDAMRKRKKAPVDGYIADRLFATLSKAAAEGWDIAKVLDKATVNNWTDLYMPTPGRDDAMRANRSTPANDQRFATEEGRKAFLAELENKPWMKRDAKADMPAGKPITMASIVAGSHQ